jgi:DnaJ-class molecular chaperone
VKNSLIRKKIVICPECGGSKEILKYNHRLMCKEVITCPVCDGKGMMSRIITVKYKKI